MLAYYLLDLRVDGGVCVRRSSILRQQSRAADEDIFAVRWISLCRFRFPAYSSLRRRRLRNRSVANPLSY